MTSKKIIVTGGGGFVGKALCKRLLSEGYEVHALGRSTYPDLEAAGIYTHQVDLSKEPEKLTSIFTGAVACFHVAATVSMWGPYEMFYQGNIVATESVINACKKTGIQRLIFTSSPSVIASGHDLCNVDESIPYPKKYDAFYPETKAKAEQLALAANSESLYTIAVRPHLIFGPGDTSLEALILKRAKAGKLVQIGDGKNLVDLCYIDDCVEGHICAFKSLESNPTCRGRAYFISQGIPTNLWEWINRLVVRRGYSPITKKVPAWLAIRAGAVLEFLARNSPIPFEPRFTKFLAEEMSTHHYFNIEAARRDLGFNPNIRDMFEW